MILISEIVREIFDNPEAHIKKIEGYLYDSYVFDVGDDTYRVFLGKGIIDNIKDDRIKMEGLEIPYKLMDIEFTKSIRSIKLHHMFSTTDISPTKNFIKVFSSIIGVVKENVDRDTVIMWTGKTNEPSRIKLYDHLIKRFMGNDYEVKTDRMPHQVKYYMVPKVLLRRK